MTTSASRSKYRSRHRRRHRSVRLAPDDYPNVGRGSVLAILLGRMLRRLLTSVEPLGRGSLYIGLLLVALTSLRLPSDFGSIADPVLLFTLICALLVVSVHARDLKLSVFKIHVVGLGLFISGILISTAAHSQNVWESNLNLSKFVFATTCMILSCVVLLKRYNHVRTALGCWVVSAAISSAFAIMQAFFGDAVIGYEHGGRGRMAGLSLNPNALGGLAGMAIAPALSLAATQTDWSRRLQWLLATSLCVSGVALSASRGGALVTLVSLVLWTALHYRLNRRFTALFVAIALAAATVSFLFFVSAGGHNIVDRTGNISQEDRGVSERLYQYDHVLTRAWHNPILGAGFAESDSNLWGHNVHNTFLRALHSGGLLSLLGISIIFLDALYKGLTRYTRAHEYNGKVIALGIFLAILAFMVHGMTDPILEARFVWIPVALSFAVWQVWLHRRSRRSTATRSHVQSHLGSALSDSSHARQPTIRNRVPPRSFHTRQ